MDSARDGPAVVYRLGALRTGEVVDVLRADRVLTRFVVTDVVSVPTSRLPTAAVHGPLSHPGLRLITCGGAFDQASSHYRDNVIVYARMVAATTSLSAGDQNRLS